MFPCHPKCSPAPPAVPAGFLRSGVSAAVKDGFINTGLLTDCTPDSLQQHNAFTG